MDMDRWILDDGWIDDVCMDVDDGWMLDDGYGYWMMDMDIR